MQKIWRNILFLYSLFLIVLHLGFRNKLLNSKINLIPFSTIKRYILHHEHFNNDIIWTNLVLRFAVFVVLGILVALAFQKLNIKVCWQSGVAVLVSTILLEIIQYTLKIGYFDIDAVILAVMGYLAGLLITRKAFLDKNNN